MYQYLACPLISFRSRTYRNMCRLGSSLQETRTRRQGLFV